MKKKITVEMTLSWTFDEKDWSDEKKHLTTLKDNPQLVLGYDVYNAWHCLNDMTQPHLANIEVINAN
jgi:hypothetical protein